MNVFKLNKEVDDANERDCSSGRVKMDQKDEDEVGFSANVTLLLVLYCLQGFPIGLADAFPYILQTRGASYSELAWFSVTTWPFSLKVIWAPIVEGIYPRRMGRRKTWVFITQMLLGISLIMLGRGGVLAEKAARLVPLFTTMILLAATQDVAVDGWAINLLPRRLVSYASLTNTVGQTIGYIIGNTIYMLVTAPVSIAGRTFDPIISESNFLFYAGCIFILITTCVLIFKREKDDDLPELSIQENIYKSYKELYNYMKTPYVVKISIMLLTLRFCYAASDSLVYPKMIEYGLKKEDMAMLSLPSIFVQIFVSYIANRMVTNRNPIRFFLKIFPFKMGMVVVSMIFIKFAKSLKHHRTYFLFSVFSFSIIQNIIHNFHYAAITYFFSLIIEPRFAGSQLTYLNTVQNLAYKWPHTLVLYLVDVFTIKKCQAEKTDCKTTLDGFYIIGFICLVAGFVWYTSFKNQFLYVAKQAMRSVKLH